MPSLELHEKEFGDRLNLIQGNWWITLLNTRVGMNNLGFGAMDLNYAANLRVIDGGRPEVFHGQPLHAQPDLPEHRSGGSTQFPYRHEGAPVLPLHHTVVVPRKVDERPLSL